MRWGVLAVAVASITGCSGDSPSAESSSQLLTEYREGVRTSGPIRLRVASVEPDDVAGAVTFEATTADTLVRLVAVLDADGSGGVCLRTITADDGTSPPPVPVWVA